MSVFYANFCVHCLQDDIPYVMKPCNENGKASTLQGACYKTVTPPSPPYTSQRWLVNTLQSGGNAVPLANAVKYTCLAKG